MQNEQEKAAFVSRLADFVANYSKGNDGSDNADAALEDDAVQGPRKKKANKIDSLISRCKLIEDYATHEAMRKLQRSLFKDIKAAKLEHCNDECDLDPLDNEDIAQLPLYH